MTNYGLYLQDDFELQDNVRIISLTNVVEDTTVTGVYAKSRGLNLREATLSGVLGIESTDFVLLIGAKRLGSETPHRGDKITTADDDTWIIVSSILNSFSDTPIYYEVIVRPTSS